MGNSPEINHFETLA